MMKVNETIQRRKGESVVALTSGGVDSMAMVAILLERGYEVYPLYLRFGFRWEEAELHWLFKWNDVLEDRRLRRVDTFSINLQDLYKRHWGISGKGVPKAGSPDSAVYIPGRNVMLLSAAALWGMERGIRTLSLGILRGNPFEDATPEFLQALGKVLSRALSQEITILTPLSTMNKEEVLLTYPNLPYEYSFSCIDPKDLRHCARCNKCMERKRAFDVLGLPFNPP